MKKNTRNIFLALGCVLLIVGALVGYGIYSVYSFFKPVFTAKEIPQAIAEPRVPVGQGWLTRTEFFKLDQQTYLETIREAGQIENEKERQKKVNSQMAKGLFNFSDISVVGDEVIAIGKFGGFIFDQAGVLKRQFAFEPSTERIKIGPYEPTSQMSTISGWFR